MGFYPHFTAGETETAKPVSYGDCACLLRGRGVIHVASNSCGTTKRREKSPVQMEPKPPLSLLGPSCSRLSGQTVFSEARGRGTLFWAGRVGATASASALQSQAWSTRADGQPLVSAVCPLRGAQIAPRFLGQYVHPPDGSHLPGLGAQSAGRLSPNLPPSQKVMWVAW